MKIALLDNPIVSKYEEFIKTFEHGDLFYSNNYRLLLKDTLDAKDFYFILMDESDKILAVMPSFLKERANERNVINSLPFYGSNGGILSSPDDIKSKTLLIDYYYKFALENNCVSSTIITSPHEENFDFYENNSFYSYKDKRIGQISNLPDRKEDIEIQLMNSFHQKTRNTIRKGLKSELEITNEISDEAWNFLYEQHNESIKNLGGVPKPKRFFASIEKKLEYGTDYKIYICRTGNNIASELLLFYYNKTVEYFTPVIKKEYRHLQPLSLIIYLAMIDASENGYKYWNWGGTWLTQDKVYFFKSRWGTTDKDYIYYTRIFKDDILHCHKNELLSGYQYFFVLPFNVLDKSN